MTVVGKGSERMAQLRISDSSSPWVYSRDGDPDALELYERHYSACRYADGRERRLFVGPGEKLVLVTPQVDALLVWREFRSMDGQDGVNCAVFRNEGPQLSSWLIEPACECAWGRWPLARLDTYVNPRLIRSANPGCFNAAERARCGMTQGGLVILERLPRS